MSFSSALVARSLALALAFVLALAFAVVLSISFALACIFSVALARYAEHWSFEPESKGETYEENQG